MPKEPFLYAISFLQDLCLAVTGLCVPLLALQLGGTYDDLGIIGAAGSCAYSLGCFTVGRLADSMGYRRLMAASALAACGVFAAYLAATRIWHLLVLAGLSGLALSGFWPCLQAWLGQGKGRRQLLRAIGSFNVAWSLGFLVGPAVAGRLYTVAPASAFGLVAGVGLLVFLALCVVPVRDGVGPPSCPEAGTLAAARHFLPVAWAANFVTFFATGSVRSLFPKLGTDLGIEPVTLGMLLSVIGLAQTLMFALVARTERWQFRLGPLAAVQGLAAAGLWLLALASSPLLLALALLLQGMLIGATFTASIFYSLHAEGPGGRRTAVHEGLVGSGVFVGPLAGGLVAEHLGPRAPYLLASAVLLCAVLVEAHLLRRRTVPAAA
ncbi:MAG: MFS transporter [Candidatus Latescibacterota bacterium]